MKYIGGWPDVRHEGTIQYHSDALDLPRIFPPRLDSRSSANHREIEIYTSTGNGTKAQIFPGESVDTRNPFYRRPNDCRWCSLIGMMHGRDAFNISLSRTTILYAVEVWVCVSILPLLTDGPIDEAIAIAVPSFPPLLPDIPPQIDPKTDLPSKFVLIVDASLLPRSYSFLIRKSQTTRGWQG